MPTFINLKNFKPKAVIDWLEIEVTLGRPTRFQFVQAKLHQLLGIEMVKSHCIRVEAQNVPMSGDLATSFRFKLHDHQHGNSAAKITNAVLGLKAIYDFARPACTIAFEIAVDFWPDKPNSAPLKELTKAVAMALAFRGDYPRQYDTSIDKEVGLLAQPEPLGTTYYVNHDKAHWHKGKWVPASDIAGKVYHKTTDRKDEDDKPIPLPSDQHRVRAEFTLRGAALKEYGLDDPLALDRINIKELCKLFHFRLILPPEERLRKTKLNKGAVKAAAEGLSTAPLLKGLVDMRQEQLSHERQCHISSWPHGLEALDPNAKGGKEPRTHSIHTIPHGDLNEMAQKGLKELFKGLGKSTRPVKPKRTRSSL